MALLKVTGLRKNFRGLRAVDDLNLTVTAGSIKALIGPNGAGKTTVLNLITRLLPADAGRLEFDGYDLNQLTAHDLSNLGMTRNFQNVQLFHHYGMTVLDNVVLGRFSLTRTGLLASGLGWRAKEEREARRLARQELEFLGLDDKADWPVDRLAFVDRRWVEMARALVARPKLLVLDEPAAGLHDTEVEKLGNLLKTLRSKGTTILLVEHNMKLVLGVSDEVLVLNYGSKLAEGSPDEIRTNPQVQAAYLGGELIAPHS